MTNNQNLDFIDALSIVQFFMGVANLDANLTQNDKQELLEDLHNQLSNVITEIHSHLETQDKKINQIYQLLTQIYKNQKEGIKDVQNPYF